MQGLPFFVHKFAGCLLDLRGSPRNAAVARSFVCLDFYWSAQACLSHVNIVKPHLAGYPPHPNKGSDTCSNSAISPPWLGSNLKHGIADRVGQQSRSSSLPKLPLRTRVKWPNVIECGQIKTKDPFFFLLLLPWKKKHTCLRSGPQWASRVVWYDSDRATTPHHI